MHNNDDKHMGFLYILLIKINKAVCLLILARVAPNSRFPDLVDYTGSKRGIDIFIKPADKYSSKVEQPVIMFHLGLLVMW